MVDALASGRFCLPPRSCLFLPALGVPRPKVGPLVPGLGAWWRVAAGSEGVSAMDKGVQ